MSTKYGVFIIESLRGDDYFDGELLEDILKLSKVEVEYSWVESEEELGRKIEEFKWSNFRYLHFSCHADNIGIQINNKVVHNEELEKLLKGKITNKRVFLSACKAGNRDLAKRLIKNGAYSLVGTPMNLEFSKAALFWPSFFHVINQIDNMKIDKNQLRYVLKMCSNLFEVPINYYSFIANARKTRLRRYKIRPKSRMDNRILKI